MLSLKGRYLLIFVVLILYSFPSLLTAGPKLPRTPRDYEGPFYPIVRQHDEDNDLIHVVGQDKAAKGDILYLSGRLVNVDGQPIGNAFVEIWQTDPLGRYKDKRDTSPGKRDPNFQYWGLAMTGGDGSFSFITLVPGAYEPRPAHIHFKVWIDRKLQLTSQMYFQNPEKLSDKGPEQNSGRSLQTVPLKMRSKGEYGAFFQIVL